MVDCLNNGMRRNFIVRNPLHKICQCLIFSTLLLTLFPVVAQSLIADPTKPPAALLMDVSDGAGEQTPTGPVLQSVLMPRQGRPVALISGQEVRLGGMFGDARLIQLNEREAVLESADGIERLQLTPDVNIRIVFPKKTAAKLAKKTKSRSTP